MDTPVSKPRWTRRRIIATTWYSFVGLLVGLMFTGLLLLVAMMIVGRLLLHGGDAASAASAAAFAPLAFLIVRSASFGTCSRHPAAPMGIAIGLAVGALFIAACCQLAGAPIIVFIAATVFGAAESYGGFVGGHRGLLVNLGTPVLGVGVMCSACAYDLSATPAGWPCPECGGRYRFPRSTPAD